MDWYLRVLIGELTGRELTKANFPMPWERRYVPKAKLTESERKARNEKFRAAMAAEVIRTGAGVL